MATWHLEDAETSAAANPSSFFIPSKRERASQIKGNLVRLHFVLNTPGPEDPRAERMWVEVKERVESADGLRYRGYLTNQPGCISDLQAGDLVEFEARHIAQTFVVRSDPRWFPAAELGALVSALVFQPGNHVRWLYRELPCNKDDSGWRVFTGDESQEFNDDPANIRVCKIGWLADFDSSLIELLRSEVGAAFERRCHSDPWIRVNDWVQDPDGL